MKKLYLILVLQILLCWNLTAQSSSQNKPLGATEKAAISDLKELVRTRQKERIADHIKYPLVRDKYFNYIIKDKTEFLKVFDRLFDEKQIEKFCQAEWEYRFSVDTEEFNLLADCGNYYGEIAQNGNLLLNSISLSESELQHLKTLIEIDKKQLHESLRGHTKPVCIIYAGKYRIRIDRMPNGKFRYASWSKDKPISSPADLVIYGGEVMGNRWWETYTFVNGKYSYVFSDSLLDGYSFVVEKNENGESKTILSIENGISVKYYRARWL